MGEPLKRTFHGCLTCRRRKVRCRGGDPCQNCRRMGVECHSSFDTNMRVTVPTPQGQKSIVRKSRTGPAQANAKTSDPSLLASGPDSTGSDSPSLLSDLTETRLNPQHARLTSEYSQPAVFVPQSTQNEIDTNQGHGNLENLLFAVGAANSFRQDGQNWNLGTFWDPRGTFNAQAIDALDAELPVVIRDPDDIIQAVAPVSLTESCNYSDVQRLSPPKKRHEMTSARQGPSPQPETSAPAGKRQTSGDLDKSRCYLRQYRDVVFGPDDDVEWGYHKYVVDFVTTRPEHCSLRLAVLAWATRNHTTRTSTHETLMEEWYSCAQKAAMHLMAMDPATELSRVASFRTAADMLIATCFYLCQYDIIGNAPSLVKSRLGQLTNWLSSHPNDLSISALSSQLLIWLTHTEIRLGIFLAETLSAPTLLDQLRRRSDYALIMNRSHSYHSELYGAEYPPDKFAQDYENIPMVLRLHDVYGVLNSILLYRGWRVPQMESKFDYFEGLRQTKLTTINNELQRLDASFENVTANAFGFSSTIPPYFSASPSPLQVGWLRVYAMFLTARILWSRMLYPNILSDVSSTASASSILQLALQMRKYQDEQGRDEPALGALWLWPLLLAGIETNDEVHADWIRILLEELGTPAVLQPPTEQVQVKTAVVALIALMREKQRNIGHRAEIGLSTKEMSQAERSVLLSGFVGQAV